MDDSLAARMKRVEALLANSGTPSHSSEIATSTEDLQQRVKDRSAGSPVRREAFAVLAERWHAEPELSQLVLAILDDPDAELVSDAIRSAPAYDTSLLERLRSLLLDPRPEIWKAAASSLARKKDRAVLGTMMSWARTGDPEHRREGLAAIAFLLIPEEHLEFVETICELGPIDEADEQVLIHALNVAEARVAFWRKALKLDEGDSD